MKQGLIFIFLLFSLGLSKACSLKQYNYCKIALGRHCQFDKGRAVSQEHDSGLPFLKRKYKAKGIHAGISSVQRFSFRGPVINNKHEFFHPGFFPVFDLQIANSFRGPPPAFS